MMKAGKRFLPLALCLGVLLALLPVGAWATDAGSSVNYQYYDTETGAMVKENVTDYTEITSANIGSHTTWNSGWYVVSGNVSTSTRITVTGDVHLILKDDASLTANKGINVGEKQSLTIYAQSEGAGKLVAGGSTSDYSAGIGGGRVSNGSADAGSITIHGGLITATGVQYGAGIGGGFLDEGSGTANGGTIAIYGGTVTATGGGSGGAGIGGGRSQNFLSSGSSFADSYAPGSADGGSITIGGTATVTATGGVNGGAGIGGGYTDNGHADGGTITISGKASVTATGNNGSGAAAGIGGGKGTNSAAGSTITISGDGEVTARGGMSGGNGIGRGSGGGSVTVTISGNRVIYASVEKTKTSYTAIHGSSAATDWSGILFTGTYEAGSNPTPSYTTGTVYGNPVLSEDLAIPAGCTLQIPENATLTINGTLDLTNGSLTNNGTLTGSGEITPEGKRLEASITDISVSPATYSGSAASVTYTYNSNGKPTVTWYADNSGTMSETELTTAPTDADTYWVKVTAEATGLYQEVEASQKFTIAKATPALSLSADRTNLTGGGSVTLSLGGVPTGATATLRYNDSSITLTEDETDHTWTATLPNTSASYTFTASCDESTNHEAASTTLTVTTTAETPVIPSIPSTPSEPEPDGPATDGSAGWSDIQTELEAAGDGDTITVEMNGTTEVPAEIFETIAGQDITVSFEMEGGVSWQVNGTDIPAGTSLSDLNLGVDMNTNGISANVINAITGEISTVQITLAYDGEFGFTMTLSAPLGEEHHGYWANLYYFDERAQRLIYQTASLIDETGHAHMRMSHASQYAIVIDDYDHGAGLPFTDVNEGDWCYDAVAYVFNNGIMTGMSDTTFEPQTATTRAMIVSMLHRLENTPSAKGSDFTDVSAADWYAEPVAWAAEGGIVGGYEDGSFQPNKSITREELASILYRYAQYKGYDVSARADLSIYTDAPSPWAADVMSWANAEGLINGRTATTIDAQATLTRAETAAIFQRFLSE